MKLLAKKFLGSNKDLMPKYGAEKWSLFINAGKLKKKKSVSTQFRHTFLDDWISAPYCQASAGPDLTDFFFSFFFFFFFLGRDARYDSSCLWFVCVL